MMDESETRELMSWRKRALEAEAKAEGLARRVYSLSAGQGQFRYGPNPSVVTVVPQHVIGSDPPSLAETALADIATQLANINKTMMRANHFRESQ